MAASVLKQAPNTQKVQKNALYYDKTQHANFGGQVILFIKIQNDTGGVLAR